MLKKMIRAWMIVMLLCVLHSSMASSLVVVVHIHHVPPPPPTPICYVKIYPGSLQANVVRLARQYGWPQVIWNVPNDYEWVGQVRVAANNLPDILRNILANYPLQANFYKGNHVLVIQARTIQA